MNKFFVTLTIFCLSNISQGQEIKFKAVKPLSIVKESFFYVGETGCKMLGGALDIIEAQFTTPLPIPEIRKYKYTFPQINFRKGKLEEVKPERKPMKGILKPRWMDQFKREVEEDIPEIEIYDGPEDFVHPLYYPPKDSFIGFTFSF